MKVRTPRSPAVVPPFSPIANSTPLTRPRTDSPAPPSATSASTNTPAASDCCVIAASASPTVAAAERSTFTTASPCVIRSPAARSTPAPPFSAASGVKGVTAGESGPPSTSPGAFETPGAKPSCRANRPPGTSATLADAVAPPGGWTPNRSPPPPGVKETANPGDPAANAASSRTRRSPTVRAPARSTVADAAFPAPSSSDTASSPGATPAPPCNAESGVSSVRAGASGAVSDGVRAESAASPSTAEKIAGPPSAGAGTPERSPAYSTRPPPRCVNGGACGPVPPNRLRPASLRFASSRRESRSAATSSASARFSPGVDWVPTPVCKIVRARIAASENAAKPRSVEERKRSATAVCSATAAFRSTARWASAPRTAAAGSSLPTATRTPVAACVWTRTLSDCSRPSCAESEPNRNDSGTREGVKGETVIVRRLFDRVRRIGSPRRKPRGRRRRLRGAGSSDDRARGHVSPGLGLALRPRLGLGLPGASRITG